MIQAVKLSIEEYHRIVAAGVFSDRRIELIEGELVELSPETPYHANRNHKLYKYLLSVFYNFADVRSSHPVTLKNSEPSPDIVLAKLPDSCYDNRHPTPEDIYLLMEISFSTLDYDLEEKKKIYADSGISEYWVLDLKNEQLIVFRQPLGGDYQQKIELTKGAINPLAFPEIKLKVRQLFSV
jgi:Uma2 family endonuclease